MITTKFKFDLDSVETTITEEVVFTSAQDFQQFAAMLTDVYAANGKTVTNVAYLGEFKF